MSDLQKQFQSERSLVTTWGTRVFLEAFDASAKSRELRSAYAETLHMAAAKAEEIANGLQESFDQETSGQRFTLNEWKDRLFFFRQKFVREVLKQASEIADATRSH